jgi:hypothetical protein
MMFFSKKDLRSAFLPGILTLLAITVPAVFFSCYPGDPITPADTDVVATFYNPAADFSSLMTYAMPDSVLQVADPDLDAGNISRQFDQLILDRIEQNLLQLGYTKVANPADADVLVLPFVSSTTWISGGCYYYWGYWYPYPGYCYPVAYTYTTGSLVIAMSDQNNSDETNALWVAGINGLMSESTTADISRRINTNIDQAFRQSPYLGEGK